MQQLPGLTLSIVTDGDLPDIGALALGQLQEDRFSGRRLRGVLRRYPANAAAGVWHDPAGKAGLAIDAGPDLALDDRPATPETVFEAVRQRGGSAVSALDGQFVLVYWDDRADTVLLASDRYGLRPHYRVETGGALLIGTAAEEMAGILGKPLRLNEMVVFSMLSFSRLSPGDMTYFEGYNALEPATLRLWDAGRQQDRTPHWDYFGAPERSDSVALLHDTADALRRAVARSFETAPRTGLCLSGGLDSRLILAAMSEGTQARTHAFTWGAKDYSDEVAIAAQCARHFGVDWSFVQTDPADFVNDLGGAIAALEGRDHVVQGYGRKAFAEVARHCSVASTGLALDILVSASYSSFLQAPDFEVGDFADKRARILDRYRYFKAPIGEMFSEPAHAYEMIEAARASLFADFGEETGNLSRQLDRFIMRQRSWRQLFPRQQWQRMFLEDVAPTFGNDLIDVLSTVSPSELANQKFSARLLAHLAPDSLDLPYQGTLLPLSAPVDYWSTAQRIEADKEALYRQIYHDTGGRVFIPYNRYFTNFDEWQRREPAWIKALDRDLLGDDSRLAARFLRRDWLQNLVAEQRSGAWTNFARINVLLTLEHLLRRYDS